MATPIYLFQFGKLLKAHVMYRSLLIFLFIFSSIAGVSQDNELIYVKTDLGFSVSTLKPFPNDSGYMVSYYSLSQEMDIGVWDEALVDCMINDSSYKNVVVNYNEHFTSFNTFHFAANESGFENPHLGDIQYYPNSNSNYILSFSKNLFPGSASSSVDPVGVYTPYGNFIPEDKVQNLFIQVDPASENPQELFRFYYQNAQSSIYAFEPYNGYFNASLDPAVVGDVSAKHDACIIGDSLLIAYLPLYDNQTLKSETQTLNYTSWNGQVNLVRVAYNLQTGEMTSQRIGSPNGNLGNYNTESTKNMDGLYRVGVVRGNNTPVSVSGNQLEMVPNDSLFHMYVTKENITGQTEWLTELYAYNNFLADTLVSNSGEYEARNQFPSIIEKNNAVFVSSILRIQGTNEDSLLFRDFLGVDTIYDRYIDVSQYSSTLQVLYCHNAIYKLDANGNVAGKLSHTNNIAAPVFNTSTYGTGNLFEVSDKLAWVNSYRALNDSLGNFYYKSADGSIDTVLVDLPAGKGQYILWLDTDLNIVDTWLIPYQSPNNWSRLDIKSVLHHHDDTLIIQGELHSNVSTSLDPFGNSPELPTSSIRNVFFAVYAAPELINTTSVADQKSPPFKIFPNPTHDVINISGIADKNADYIIYDIAGRIVEKGKLLSSQINTQSLKPGMYILSIESDEGSGVQKFVVR